MNEQPKTLHEQVQENQRLVSENNRLLRSLIRRQRVSFWFRMASLLIFLGAPFLVYYYVLQPYFQTFGSSFETFQQGLQEMPGWKQFYESFEDIPGIDILTPDSANSPVE